MNNGWINGFQLRVPDIQLPEMPDMPNWYMWSDTQFELIKKYIEEFEVSLDTEHEVGVMLTNFGQSVLMLVTEIGHEKIGNTRVQGLGKWQTHYTNSAYKPAELPADVNRENGIGEAEDEDWIYDA